jgi:hypothetical protein
LVEKAVTLTVQHLESDRDLARVCTFLTGYRDGEPIVTIGKTVGLSREHCSRHVKPRAVALVTQTFAMLQRTSRKVRRSAHACVCSVQA